MSNYLSKMFTYHFFYAFSTYCHVMHYLSAYFNTFTVVSLILFIFHPYLIWKTNQHLDFLNLDFANCTQRYVKRAVSQKHQVNRAKNKKRGIYRTGSVSHS